MARWIFSSVSTSIAAVASSIKMMLHWLRSALAMTMSCLCPTEKLPPSSSTLSSRPEILSLPASPMRPTLAKMSTSLESGNVPNGSRLALTVPLNRTGSWGTMASLLLRACSPSEEASTPSRRMRPPLSSAILSNATIRLLFPAPVRPTTPTRAPAGIVRLNPFRTKGSPGRYLISTSSNFISPCGKLLGSLSSAGVSLAASGLISLIYWLMRSTLTICASKSLLILTDQFRLCVTLRAKLMLSPAAPAKVSSPAIASCSRTAHRQAKVTIAVPANSSLTASQHWAEKVRKKAVWLEFRRLTTRFRRED
mmetsp:Transcript_23870/g.47498  ORF Transcript_23870/g.47498 Transcript_23870/m.47498 type:complete len:309 (-) Transcript_23870:857-1783(-)